MSATRTLLQRKADVSRTDEKVAIFIESENRLTGNGIHEWAKTGDAIVLKHDHYTDREAPKQPPQPKGESKGGVTGSEVRPVRFR